MTPEGRVKAAIKKVLAKFEGVHAHWPVQNGMGAPTLDCVGCAHGRYFAIEAKAPGERPTVRQQLTIKSMVLAGATVFVIDGDTEELEAWLCETTETSTV